MTAREITADEHQTLILANQGAGHIVIVPVMFNGEARVALALHGQNRHGQYLRVLGILLVPDDNIQDVRGNPTSPLPPGMALDVN
jgi:hypothetical protein